MLFSLGWTEQKNVYSFYFHLLNYFFVCSYLPIVCMQLCNNTYIRFSTFVPIAFIQRFRHTAPLALYGEIRYVGGQGGIQTSHQERWSEEYRPPVLLCQAKTFTKERLFLGIFCGKCWGKEIAAGRGRPHRRLGWKSGRIRTDHCPRRCKSRQCPRVRSQVSLAVSCDSPRNSPRAARLHRVTVFPHDFSDVGKVRMNADRRY